MITVGNGYHDGWLSGHYIGRAGKGKIGSALANPFKLSNPKDNDERSQVVAQYRRWLWERIRAKDPAVLVELNQLREQAQTGDVRLLCFCKQPNQEVTCHGDVIKSCLDWMLRH